jgi:K+-sensing histidine kinase KdpD
MQLPPFMSMSAQARLPDFVPFAGRTPRALSKRLAPLHTYFSAAQTTLILYSRRIDTSADPVRTQMAHELADIRALAYVMGKPAILIAMATSALFALDPILPPNLVWLGYLTPVIVASVRWGLASAAVAAVIAGLAGDFFFTQPHYSFWMEDPRDVVALLLFLLVGFGSAALVTSARRAGRMQPACASAVAPLPEPDECQTSRDVVVQLGQWISIVAQGRTVFIDARPLDIQLGLLPDEVERVAIAMCWTKSLDVRTLSFDRSRRWILKQFRADDAIRGVLAVETDTAVCDPRLVEAAIARAAARFSDLARREAEIAAAQDVADFKFSQQWRNSLTIVLGAASVLLMRPGISANRLERTLLVDIRDEATRLCQLLTSTFSTTRAATLSCQIEPAPPSSAAGRKTTR